MPFDRYPFELPPLRYPYDSLEPYIDEETMYYHHDEHFAAYVENLNQALTNNPKLQRMTLLQLLRNPSKIPLDVVRNAGGVYNHMLFFDKIAPEIESNHMPSGRLAEMINKTFGSFDRFKMMFSQRANELFGSGWTYLTLTPQRTLRIVNKPNQDTPIAENETTLILFDVWEHAYYLGYRNMRDDYIEQLWHVITFPDLD